MSNLQFAKNLQYLRKCRNMDQKEVSTRLSISRQAYSNYETRKRTPDLDTLLQLSWFYGVDLSTLVLKDIRGMDKRNSRSSSKISEDKVPYISSENENTGNKLYITEDEQNLILKFRSLSPEYQKIVTGFINDSSRGNA